MWSLITRSSSSNKMLHRSTSIRIQAHGWSGLDSHEEFNPQNLPILSPIAQRRDYFRNWSSNPRKMDHTCIIDSRAQRGSKLMSHFCRERPKGPHRQFLCIIFSTSPSKVNLKHIHPIGKLWKTGHNLAPFARIFEPIERVREIEESYRKIYPLGFYHREGTSSKDTFYPTTIADLIRRALIHMCKEDLSLDSWDIEAKGSHD